MSNNMIVSQFQGLDQWKKHWEPGGLSSLLSGEEGEVYQPLTLDAEESGRQQIEYHLDFKSSLVW